MKTRRLGKHDLPVSEIGFGCGTGSQLMIDGDPRDQVAAVKRALEAGITYFDTAAIYGAGRSETALGSALATLGASPTVATKVALELSDLDDIAGATVASIEGSLRRLRRDNVAIVQLHNRVGPARKAKGDVGVGALLTVDDVLGRNGVVEGFRRAKERGLVEYFGCCAYGGEAAQLNELIDSDAFATILVHYSMLNQTAFVSASRDGERDYHGVAARAAARGMGISVLRVLEAGLLAGNSREQQRPGYERESVRLRAFDALRTGDEPLTETAIRFALSNPAVSTVLVGISEISHIEQAVAAAAAGPLSKAALSAIESLRN